MTAFGPKRKSAAFAGGGRVVKSVAHPLTHPRQFDILRHALLSSGEIVCNLTMLRVAMSQLNILRQIALRSAASRRRFLPLWAAMLPRRDGVAAVQMSYVILTLLAVKCEAVTPVKVI
jgi:hypothetical protein